MQNARLFLLALLALGGCESEADKLHDLQASASTARLDSVVWQARLDSLFPGWPEAAKLQSRDYRMHPHNDSVRAATLRIQLADRDLARFMR